MVRKQLLFALLIFLVGSIFACKPPSDMTTTGTNISTTTTSGTGEVTTGTGTTVTTTGERVEQFESGATEVVMWIHDFEDWNNMLNFEQRKDFNDNLDDGIQLEQVLVDTDNFEDLIRSARETGNVPDIYMVSYGNLYKDVQNGYVTDLTSYFPQTAWDDLYSTAEYGIKYDGKYYAYPILMEPSTLLMYRKDLLQLYGETDEVPTNWDDFLILLETIKTNIQEAGARGIYPFDVPKGVALGWASWGIQLAATNGFAITEDWTTSRLLETGYTDMAELWQSLYSNRYVPLSSGDYTEVINDLCLDKLVFATAGSWSIATVINDFPDLIDDIGVMPMPTFDGNQEKATATNGGWVYVISSISEHKEEAAAVIEYLVASNPEVPIEYFRGARYSKTSPRISVQEAIIAELETQDTVPSEWIEVLSSVASYAPMEPIYSWDISVAVASMLENVALGNSVASEIQAAHSTITSLIQSNNLANNNPRDDG